MAGGNPQVHSATLDFFLSVILICYDYLKIFELSLTLKRFIACVFDFVLYAVHGTETYFQLSQHLLQDQSAYSGLMKHVVCLL